MTQGYIKTDSYVEGREVKTNQFYRGNLVGYALYDKTNPESIVAEVAINNSRSVLITLDSLKLVSQYETVLKALEDCGLKYENGKIVGRHIPKFKVGDTVRHKNYGELTMGNATITYVSEIGYSYILQNGSGGGTFGFTLESDYYLIKENKDERIKC